MAEPRSEAKRRNYMPAERQDIILSVLTRQSSVTVAELTELLNTTEITVRRDLAALAKVGLLKRVRGGAMSVSGNAKPAEIVADERRRDASSQSAPTTAKPSNLGKAAPIIGVMLPEPSFFWPSVIEHMRTIAEHHGMRLIVRESAYEQDIHEEHILDEFASNKDICGIICAPNSKSFGRRTWDWISESPIPVVAVERDEPILHTCHIDSVHTNHPYSARQAATHFLTHGHTRIGAAFTLTPTSQIIADGWRQVVETGHIDCPFIFEHIPPYDAKSITDIVDAIIDTHVTAMFIHSDYLAIAIAQALEQRGKKVPEHVSMISVDGFATVSTRPLTVVRSPSADLAQLAVDTLLMRLHHPDSATRHILIDPQLIDRGSVINR